MAKYTLKDGESRHLTITDTIRVEAFEIGAGGAQVELAIVPEGVNYTRVDDLLLIVHAVTQDATIQVRPKGFGTFGLRSEIRLNISNGEDTVSFPRVLIDAAEDSPERLAEWLGDDEDGQVQDVNIEYVAPSGTPGIDSVTFRTPKGAITL